jgi:TIR domain
MLPKDTLYYENRIWKDGYFKLFISHVSNYKHKAKELEKELDQYHISSFVAHLSIEPMEEWQNILLHALASADAMVVLLHNGFHLSKWTDQEVGIAIGRRILVIPIMFGEAPYGFISKYQAVFGIRKSNEQLGKEIYNLLSTNYQTRSIMENTLIDLLSKSSSKKEVLHNLARVESIENPSESHYYLLKNALENKYIKQSDQIKQRVDNLLSKFWQANHQQPNYLI